MDVTESPLNNLLRTPGKDEVNQVHVVTWWLPGKVHSYLSLSYSKQLVRELIWLLLRLSSSVTVVLIN